MSDKASQEELDLHWMRHAYGLAQRAAEEGEVPVGAVLVWDNVLIAEGWNCPISSNDPTAHAEINVLRAAARELDNYRLVDTTLYVTLEPCVMCAGALIHARVRRLVYGASEPKSGAVDSVFEVLGDPRHNHKVEVCGGVMAQESAALLQAFFKSRRNA